MNLRNTWVSTSSKLQTRLDLLHNTVFNACITQFQSSHLPAIARCSNAKSSIALYWADIVLLSNKEIASFLIAGGNITGALLLLLMFWALFFTKPLASVGRFAERTGKKRSEVLNAPSDVVLLIVFLSSGSCWRPWQSSCWVNGLFEVRPHKSWTSVSDFFKVFRACKKRLTLCQNVFRKSKMFFLWQELRFVFVLVSLTYYSAIQCE